MASIEIKNLDVSLGNKKVLDNLSFNLGSGQIAALLGPSGCGKTTLLRTIAGLLQPSTGTIRFDKQLVSLSSLVLPAHKRKIGYVPQDGALFPHLNVEKNIAFGLDKSSLTKMQIFEQSLPLSKLRRPRSSPYPLLYLHPYPLRVLSSATSGYECEVDGSTSGCITFGQLRRNHSFGPFASSGWGSRGRRFKTCRPD